jgi:hypothetical protein
MPPITADEVPTLAALGLSLGQDLTAAFSPASEGGKKITMKELRKLAGKAAQFAAIAIRDAID